VSEEHVGEVEKLNSEIVERSREARFSKASVAAWGPRVEALIAAREGSESVVVSGLRAVDEAAGGSNGTLLFNAQWTSSTGRIETADLVFRFLPAKGLFHAYDIKAQFDIQNALAHTPVPVPNQRWLDDQGEFLGVPGYVMERVPGRSTPMTWMVNGLYVDASPENRRVMQCAYIEALANIHSVDWRSLGLDFLLARADQSHPIARETQWYWDSLIWSGDDEYVPQLQSIRDWLIENEPLDVDSVLCHGDSNLGNYLFENFKITAVVDWEMAFIGHRECDLAMFIVGNESLQADVPRPEGTLSEQDFIEEYERLSGQTLINWEYYKLFASYRSVVITLLARQHFEGDFLEIFNGITRSSVKAAMSRAAAFGIATK
jgi:aminoglycoside phosphotransferase (APT) family kinase protein